MTITTIAPSQILFAMTWLGDPIPKGRPRHGRSGHSFTPARTRIAEDALRQAIDAEAPQEPYEGPVELHATFHCATARRTDFDNLVKLLTDCLQRGRRETGGIIADDSQIVRSVIDVHRGAREEARTEFVVLTLDRPTPTTTRKRKT